MVQCHNDFSLGALRHVYVDIVDILVIHAAFTSGLGRERDMKRACGFWPSRSSRGREGLTLLRAIFDILLPTVIIDWD